MALKLSRFGERYARDTGARVLMEDLGEALSGSREILMLGGGNPAYIPAVQTVLREQMAAIAADADAFSASLGDYAPPAGDARFVAALAAFLREHCGWPVTARNIALTGGSQNGFFVLFNLLAGACSDGSRRHVLLPLLPEYIGYADLGLDEGLFRARRPLIELQGRHRFKYRVDFDALDIDADTAAICVSRPTNPTGNVISDEELARLAGLAREHDIPLILDSAYGLPFPGIVFVDAGTPWYDNLVVCMSLSKLGLPGARTGIIIGPEDIVSAVSAVTAVTALAVSSIGPALVRPLLEDGRLLALSRQVIQPFYAARAEQALAIIDEAFAGLDYRVHVAEGAFFLWLWFPGLPISSEVLYQRLKARGVLVLSGHYFFPGLEGDWPHSRECLRVSYAQPEAVVRAGIAGIAAEVRALTG
jgi:valine--pyruvate aminotransferase